MIYHSGGFEGWRSVYSFMPERKIAFGALTNAGLSHSPLELVSAYVDDRLLHVPDVEKTYAEKLAQLRARFDTVKKNQMAEVAKRAQRPWTLSRPLASYAGRYEDPGFGTLTIALRDGKLFASIDRLTGELQPFTEPETARVELIPGSGDMLRFLPDAVVWNGETLPRREGADVESPSLASGRSSVGRVGASQALGRGFESRRPLQ